jgi:hypothetical protein
VQFCGSGASIDIDWVRQDQPRSKPCRAHLPGTCCTHVSPSVGRWDGWVETSTTCRWADQLPKEEGGGVRARCSRPKIGEAGGPADAGARGHTTKAPGPDWEEPDSGADGSPGGREAVLRSKKQMYLLQPLSLIYSCDTGTPERFWHTRKLCQRCRGCSKGVCVCRSKRSRGVAETACAPAACVRARERERERVAMDFGKRGKPA